MRHDAERKPWLRLHAIQSVTLFCLSASVATASKAITPVPNAQKATLWKQLQSADMRVQASQTRWLRLVTSFPNDSVNVTRQEELAAEQARQRGASAAEIQKARSEAHRLSDQQARGTTQTAKLEVVHQFPRTRCVVLEYLPVSTGTPFKTKPFSVVWETYDGKNAISVEGVNKMTPYIGTISRDPQRILSRSLPSAAYRIFLAASPITKYFAASDIVQNTSSAVVLQRPMPESKEFTMRLTVSKKIWRPARMDVFFSGRLTNRYEAQSYKRFSGGILFPTHVVVSSFGGKGVSTLYDYKLQSAVFNAVANTKLIDQAIPPGANIVDGRLGQAMGVPYRSLGGKAPSDSKVSALMRKQQAFRAAAQQTQKQATRTAQADLNGSSSLPTVLGLLLMGTGIGLWSRSRRPPQGNSEQSS